MKVLSRTSDGLKRCYNVLITLKEVEQVEEIKLREVAKKMKVDGFRPGKVPVNVARRLYGDSIAGEAKQQLLIILQEKFWQMRNYRFPSTT